MLRFVTPETRTLTLADGETITIHKKLTHGQRKEHWERVYKFVNDKLEVNQRTSVDALIIAYLVDWTIKGLDGQPWPIRGISADELQDVLNAMSEESVREIRQAIAQHEAEMLAEENAQKKIAGGGPVLVETLQSAAS